MNSSQNFEIRAAVAANVCAPLQFPNRRVKVQGETCATFHRPKEALGSLSLYRATHVFKSCIWTLLPRKPARHVKVSRRAILKVQGIFELFHIMVNIVYIYVV